MSNYNQQKSFLPQCDGAALDFIKSCAAIFMITDYINTIWFHQAFISMNFIGRGTFPLFCYAVAAAVLKVKDSSLQREERKKIVRRYLKRLLILAAADGAFPAEICAACFLSGSSGDIKGAGDGVF